MKNGTITLIIFLLVLLMMAVIWVPRAVIERTGSVEDTLLGLYRSIREEKWAEADVLADQLKIRWKRQRPWVALNYAEEDYSKLDETIIRLLEAVASREKQTASADCAAARRLFENTVRLIPEP